jgi:adenylylsulfate kinase-like enzyme
VKNFTGINSPYEEPKNSDIVIKTNEVSVEQAMEVLMGVVVPKIQVK